MFVKIIEKNQVYIIFIGNEIVFDNLIFILARTNLM